MSVKFYENALTALKKANAARKMVLAGKAGYSSVEEYKSFLESQVRETKDKESLGHLVDLADENGTSKPKVKKEKPVVIVFDIVDCSSSMSGAKLSSAVKGVNNGVSEMKKETLVDYKYGLCDFSGRHDCNITNIKSIKDVSTFEFWSRGMTALNDAVVKVLNKIKNEKTPEQKALVNIYTDGEENCSASSDAQVKKLVRECEANGFTITFIGTERDTRNIIRTFDIKESNTQSYDGTADGLANSMILNASARGTYANKLSKGLDVTVGFFQRY